MCPPPVVPGDFVDVELPCSLRHAWGVDRLERALVLEAHTSLAPDGKAGVCEVLVATVIRRPPPVDGRGADGHGDQLTQVEAWVSTWRVSRPRLAAGSAA